MVQLTHRRIDSWQTASQRASCTICGAEAGGRTYNTSRTETYSGVAAEVMAKHLPAGPLQIAVHVLEDAQLNLPQRLARLQHVCTRVRVCVRMGAGGGARVRSHS